jgi:hypothetical protein
MPTDDRSQHPHKRNGAGLKKKKRRGKKEKKERREKRERKKVAGLTNIRWWERGVCVW